MNKHKNSKVCPDCGGAPDAPAPYWVSNKPDQEELYCTSRFHDPTIRLLQELQHPMLG